MDSNDHAVREGPVKEEYERVMKRIKEREKRLDKIRGCIFGGAVGDALGYPVEFLRTGSIFEQFGKDGITSYRLGPGGKALISDDTQMSLFTATGVLIGDTRIKMRGIGADPSAYVAKAYDNWLTTQQEDFGSVRETMRKSPGKIFSWLMDISELYERRAPGLTCLSALEERRSMDPSGDYISEPLNDSKGCGGIMRIAPLSLFYDVNRKRLDHEAAQVAAITHGHSLGYMPAAVLSHILNRLLCEKERTDLKEIVFEARDAAAEIFSGDEHIGELSDVINTAVRLSENVSDDLTNISRIGAGWVAEETLGIAIYSALRHEDDFSAGIIAAVNHDGDSDSTGSVTGNILGLIHGYTAIDDKWKKDLELSDIILETADDICHGCQMSEYSSYHDDEWVSKYIKMRYPKKTERK